MELLAYRMENFHFAYLSYFPLLPISIFFLNTYKHQAPLWSFCANNYMIPSFWQPFNYHSHLTDEDEPSKNISNMSNPARHTWNWDLDPGDMFPGLQHLISRNNSSGKPIKLAFGSLGDERHSWGEGRGEKLRWGVVLLSIVVEFWEPFSHTKKK